MSAIKGESDPEKVREWIRAIESLGEAARPSQLRMEAAIESALKPRSYTVLSLQRLNGESDEASLCLAEDVSYLH